MLSIFLHSQAPPLSSHSFTLYYHYIYLSLLYPVEPIRGTHLSQAIHGIFLTNLSHNHFLQPSKVYSHPSLSQPLPPAIQGIFSPISLTTTSSSHPRYILTHLSHNHFLKPSKVYPHSSLSQPIPQAIHGILLTHLLSSTVVGIDSLLESSHQQTTHILSLQHSSQDLSPYQ
jgi:hypothetical protein